MTIFTAGCGGSGAAAQRPAASRPVDRTVTRGLDATDRFIEQQAGPPAQTDPDAPAPAARPVALVDGRPITFDALRPWLVEASGGVVLEEAVLDALLEREAERRSITISRAQIDAERDRLTSTFTASGMAADATEAGRLLARLRASRGLGDARFAALLRRNATLRALVAEQVTVTPGALDQAYAMRYGERSRARLITVASANEAADIARQARAGADFATLAAQRSTDSSAERGGLLEPISPLDPAYPAAVRSTLRAMKPGEISDPVALENGFGVLQLVEQIPAVSPAPSRVDAEKELEAAVRLEQERLLMNQLARRLLDGARVTVTDRALDRAWRTRTQGE